MRCSEAVKAPQVPVIRFRVEPPIVVGVVGGIASGKSAVAGMLAEHGLEHVDADAHARLATERDDVRAALRVRFGAGVFAPDGTLDRTALAAVVFASEGARKDVEAIVHPPVRLAIRRALDAARAAGRSVVLDVPLLLEGGLVAECDAVVFVDTSPTDRLARARARGWDAAELQRRESSQLPLAVKSSAATATIHNSGTLDDARAQVARLLEAWSRRPPVRSIAAGPRS